MPKQHQTGEKRAISRRDFLKTAAAGAATLGLGTFARMPAHARVIGANDRINMGVIGCGGMGTGHLNELAGWQREGAHGVQVIAVCDVYEARKERAKRITGARVYHHYGDLLARDDVDAVLIATPDHWHAQISIDAMLAGKDVYCEKPMTLYWEEAKAVRDVVRATGRVFQCGAQSCSEGRFHTANELIRGGEIGKLLWSQGGYSRNSTDGEWNWGIDEGAGPNASGEGKIDWELWQGPARRRPWDPERYFRFRKFWDYSGGIATDLFFHVLSHLQVALGPEFPRRVSSAGGIYVQHDREVPDTLQVLLDYPSDHTVLLVSSMANRIGVPDVIRGHEATLYFEEGPGVVVRPESEFASQHPERVVPPGPSYNHKLNFLQCVRDRTRPTCNIDVAYRTEVGIALSVIATREQRTVLFDPEKEEVIGGTPACGRRPVPLRV